MSTKIVKLERKLQLNDKQRIKSELPGEEEIKLSLIHIINFINLIPTTPLKEGDKSNSFFIFYEVSQARHWKRSKLGFPSISFNL